MGIEGNLNEGSIWDKDLWSMIDLCVCVLHYKQSWFETTVHFTRHPENRLIFEMTNMYSQVEV